MRIVLLSGGSGKRLWPMSNDVRSKQFLRVLPGVDGRPESMLQRVWRQLHEAGIQSDAYICASKAQAEIIYAQLGSVPVIEEPMRRDTFPAIAMSVLHLMDVHKVPADEPIAICPVDHYVDDHYFKEIATLGDVLMKSNADLALMGVEPTSPTSKFGYILPRGTELSSGILQVEAFFEKPEEVKAQQLIEKGALWNCGVFCFRGQLMLNVLERANLPTRYAKCVREFSEFPKRSFDYEVVEQAKSIAVHPYRGVWNDLGTWESLADHMAAEEVGPAMRHECVDTHIVNELGIPVVTLGLNHAIVVATPDGVLAADKSMSAQLKEVIGAIQNRPMYEERIWGTYRVLDYQKLDDGTEVLTKTIELYPEQNISYQKHMMRSEVWTVIEGHGEVVLDTRRFEVGPGDVVRVYADQWHAIRTFTGLKLIEIQRGSELIEEDIVRRYLTWSELEHALGVGVGRV